MAEVTEVSAQLPTQIFGTGLFSCATWDANPPYVAGMNAWILGYWSGLNSNNVGNHRVGKSTDANGILAEVHRVCSDRPSLSLFLATREIYTRFLREER